MRLLSPHDKCVGFDTPDRSRRYDGLIVDVPERDARLMREAGYTMADIGGAPVRRGGFECTECTFRSYFKVCGRCGAACRGL
jgi:hypothetical protein